VGSPSPAARAQVRALAAGGARWTDVDAADLLDLSARELAGRAAALAARPPGAAVISVSGAVDPAARAAVATALARLCAQAVAGAELTVVSGGATARAVLTRAGVTALTLLGEVAPGVVLSRTSAHRPERVRHVITKSGSFGGRDALTGLVAAAGPSRGEL
jgi:D-threonate/D-erythronate kinase